MQGYPSMFYRSQACTTANPQHAQLPRCGLVSCLPTRAAAEARPENSIPHRCVSNGHTRKEEAHSPAGCLWPSRRSPALILWRKSIKNRLSSGSSTRNALCGCGFRGQCVVNPSRGAGSKCVPCCLRAADISSSPFLMPNRIRPRIIVAQKRSPNSPRSWRSRLARCMYSPPTMTCASS